MRASIMARRRWVSHGPSESPRGARRAANARCEPTRLSVPVTKVRLTDCAPTRENALFITPITKLMAAIAPPCGQQMRLREADDHGEPSCDRAEHDPPRKAASGLHEQGPGERADDEEQDRQAESAAAPNRPSAAW